MMFTKNKQKKKGGEEVRRREIALWRIKRVEVKGHV